MCEVIKFDTQRTKPTKRNRQQPAQLCDLDSERHIRTAEYLSYQKINDAIRDALAELEGGASKRKVRLALRAALDATYSKAAG